MGLTVVLDSSTKSGALTRLDRYGKLSLVNCAACNSDSHRSCERCGACMADLPRPTRRSYCSSACKQAAYRKRTYVPTGGTLPRDEHGTFNFQRAAIGCGCEDRFVALGVGPHNLLQWELETHKPTCEWRRTKEWYERHGHEFSSTMISHATGGRVSPDAVRYEIRLEGGRHNTERVIGTDGKRYPARRSKGIAVPAQWMVERRAQGASYREIASEAGLSHQTIMRLFHRLSQAG